MLVVGASLAGVQAAQTLRREGYDGSITLLGGELHHPYDRPPLSKQYLAGSWTEEKLRLRAAADPEALGVEWRMGRRATGLALDERIVSVDGGDEVAFDGLVIATGARPRLLPGTEGRAGVHTLRTLDDALALRAAFEAGSRRVVVIGAGFIGAEVAATARQRGLEVTMVEVAPAPLARVLDPASGMAIADLHRQHGVDVRLGVGVDEVRGDPVESVVLSDGSVLEADVVVVGIGVVPETDWLAGSGLTVEDGVVCDETCLAAPGVVAAGDVCRWPNRRFGDELRRVEQWDNAVDQGAYAARRLLAWAADEPLEPFTPVPWFWSDQYDRKIQLAGVSGPHHEVVHGSLDEQRFVQLFAEGDRLVGTLTWNRPRHAIRARQLIAEGTSVDDARTALAD